MNSDLLQDVLAGLSSSPKTLPSKHFYDAEGSRLFEDITRLPEYYLTRTETALLADIAGEVAALVPEGGSLIEFGSGASVKTRILLDAAPHLARYVPIDISASALDGAARELRSLYPDLLIEPVEGDIVQTVELSPAVKSAGRMGFFPGSTLGNFAPSEQESFLRSALAMLGEGASFLIGVDLVKDEETLLRAYDDAAGVTAAFNRNLLARIRRELASDIEPEAFEHKAIWNAPASRIEMHMVSRSEQTFTVQDRRFQMRAGETIHTENSYKFTIDGLTATAEAAGWRAGQAWTSPDPAYALLRLSS